MVKREKKSNLEESRLAVAGLGYVGLPLEIEYCQLIRVADRSVCFGIT